MTTDSSTPTGIGNHPGSASNNAVASEEAVLGGGCFWCTEAVFLQVDGVLTVESGYAGGHVSNPTYEAICTGTTGHAEVVRVRYDPAKLRYRDVLEIFFATHDPTTLNRQGNDVGTQYRSVVFTLNNAQAEQARQVIAALNAENVFGQPIVTEVTALDGNYFPAEAYHQDYFAHHPNQGYCAYVIAPKVAKMRMAFAHRLKDRR
ncbi:peptide-methionine (S)-S-oxide reductase MsrA [Robbsia andropogonis]|uniref:peptide-methionine (S)-S-oxide reductase MsrA n=1 Tax=Robbsia andropogonis TaxID=28092 RepID=UPI00046799FB|nr:peptide-methionine (S)-S-oxide reductase MsrA [Robbsia andropogonis]MCP1116713.1 peptide-methionine (S)-S-oxide reductase MsrA [Robbsia andropogonis]MCP1126608.1 peptide-methionine (S)-S-oxide reductase MsrA [Robbsia andropogonis]